MSQWISISCADTAKLLRAALKSAFPGVAFSVKSKTYSMGASITVSWTDGPSSPEVTKVCNRFECADFDGMTDCKNYRHHARLANGEIVRFGRSEGLPDGAEEVHLRADYIFTDRTYSREFLERVAKKTADYWGCDPPTIAEHGGTAYFSREQWERVGGSDFTASELAQQTANKASRVNGGIIYPK
jgi:hypothetical protein